MQVELLDFTGKDTKDEMWYAAKLLIYSKNTRLGQTEETRKMIDSMSQDKMFTELEAISKTLRSSWEFVDYTFQLSGVTRAFCQQLTRTRTASYAAEAQRVVDLSNFKAEKPVTCQEGLASEVWDICMKDITRTYKKLQELGIPNQDCRGVVPMNIHTRILVKMNLRTLADLVGKRDNLRAQGEYVSVIRAMVEKAMKVHPWLTPFLYPERLQTPELDKILAELLGTSGPLDKPKLNAALKELDSLKGTWG